jgi:hypothetical protein
LTRILSDLSKPEASNEINKPGKTLILAVRRNGSSRIMKTPPKSKSWRWLVLFGLYVFLSCTAHAQVNFVQITDPHIFDDIKEDGSRLNNKAALASFVEKINQRVAEKSAEDGGTYDFVVITGDLGIDQLVKGLDETGRGNSLKAAAVELASVIGLSKVTTWLFVPGNNDLLDEQPLNIKYYHEFIEALKETIKGAENKTEIIDLCAEGNQPAKEEFFQIRNYTFIGFNDASFKNTDLNSDGSPRAGGPAVRINENFDSQMKNVADVSRQVNDKKIQFAYIFYHIPEIDDPYYVTLTDQDEPLKTRSTETNLIGSPYLYSSWFVKSDVRKEWNKVVTNPKVMGLFAGNFHDHKRSTYQNFQWLRSPFYLSDTIAKLHVCPPLALTKQKDKDGQARGFQEVYIDKDGRVSTRIFWLEQAGWNLSAEVAELEAASLKQLELGQTYEGLNRLKEAEAAYVKAAESNWTPTRQRALKSLTRVAENQDSFFSKNVGAPLSVAWGAGLTAVGTAFATAVLTLVGLGIIWLLSIPFKRRWREKGRNKVKIGPIIDSPKGSSGLRFERLLAKVHERLRTHFRPRNLMRGVPRLPLVASSQSAEVMELVEEVVPGAVGKHISSLLKKKDQSQYSIEGVIEARRWSCHVFFISLRDNYEDRLLKNWHKASYEGDIIVDERKLAFAAMKHLVRHMHR